MAFKLIYLVNMRDSLQQKLEDIWLKMLLFSREDEVLKYECFKLEKTK
jgi:hypothetical protein